jgi:hypothetical protein
MRKIDKPLVSVSTVFEQCISNIRDKGLKIELENSIKLIQDAENNFDQKKQVNEIYLIDRNAIISTIVNADVLKSIYTDRLVNKKNQGRIIYNSILISAPKEKCPLCNQRIADTLDHYLPKSEYPILAVSPLNLVPACTACNKGKLMDYPTNSEEETLHPYYDDIENENWLNCELLMIKPIIFNYYVQAPLSWDSLLKNRVENHFSSFNINKLYKIHSAQEFENIKHHLEKLFINGGTSLLKEHLLDSYDSRKLIDKNSWQTVFYGCLLNNISFCNGGFI